MNLIVKELDKYLKRTFGPNKSVENTGEVLFFLDSVEKYISQKRLELERSLLDKNVERIVLKDKQLKWVFDEFSGYYLDTIEPYEFTNPSSVWYLETKGVH